ncbi:PAS domain-containing protein (plasmid) [Rhodococcus sp. USK10]|uniref:PAS domain-containing protein n=1 Tax=Rhodococcus sp. USK10 TaxID=2789739 RepID=UPI001C5F81BA|nr:PAS domain-containing protein [Rhodococcus sp. USK10]QYA99935.1 PAS domain-containing protein [Rhodococcus sp. USK10]
MEDQSVPTRTCTRPNGYPFFIPTVQHDTTTAPCRTEMLEALFAVLPQPLSVFDDQRQMLFANPASANLVGYRVEQLIGDYEWLLLPSDTPRWRRFLRDSHGSKAFCATFFRLRHRSGDWLWVRAAASAFTVHDAHLTAVTWQDCSGDLCEDPRTIVTGA